VSTLATLAAVGKIERIEEGILLEWECAERRLYGTPGFIRWMHRELPRLDRDLHPHATPQAQVYDLFRAFLLGEDLDMDDDLKPLQPHALGQWEKHAIWELKTADLRIFGWFAEKFHFVCTAGVLARVCKDYSLYGRLRNDAVNDRTALGLPHLLSQEIRYVC
jgi:hypothetical protein